MKQPDFLREYSKEESQGERDAIAQDIRQSRAEYFESKKEKEESLENKKQEAFHNEEMIRETLEQISDLRDRVDQISSTLPSKILNFVEYIKIKSRLKNSSANLDTLQSDQNLQTQEQFDIQKELDSLDISTSMKDAKEAISNFYKHQEEKWSQAEYSKEDIEKYFTPKHLVTLSIEEYITLLKRFPNQMVTHVTRQGIRDHVGAVNHHAGIDKLWNGFKDIVDVGGLKSSFDIHVTEDAKQEELIQFLNLENKTKEEAVREVEYLAGEDTQHHHGSMADRMSLHAATEEVADAHYGAETGNEIFFAYPSMMIASQYIYSGQLNKAGGGYHNNQWIFADEGLDVNSGLVFIPKDTPVDKRTGSKYQLNENFEPIENDALQNTLKNLISQENFIEFIKTQEEFLGSGRFEVEALLDFEPQTMFQQEAKEKILALCETLRDTFDVVDIAIQKLILNYSFIHNLIYGDRKDLEKIIQNRMAECGLKFSLAQDAVASSKYWEEYFAQYPDKKPNKIVYYEGKDPTRALQDWKQLHDLGKSTFSPEIDFDSHRINLADSNQVQTQIPRIGRFKSLAHKVIDEFYTSNLK